MLTIVVQARTPPHTLALEILFIKLECIASKTIFSEKNKNTNSFSKNW